MAKILEKPEERWVLTAVPFGLRRKVNFLVQEVIVREGIDGHKLGIVDGLIGKIDEIVIISSSLELEAQCILHLPVEKGVFGFRFIHIQIGVEARIQSDGGVFVDEKDF